MKYVFVLIVLMNIAVFVGYAKISDDDVLAAMPLESEVGGIELQGVDLVEEALCYALTGYSEEDVALQDQMQLKALGYDEAELVRYELEGAELYAVSIFNLQDIDKARAITKILNDERVDNFILNEDTGGYSIALGRYTVKENSENIQKQVNALGFVAEIWKPDSETTRWRVNVVVQNQVDLAVLNKVLDNFSSKTRKIEKKVC